MEAKRLGAAADLARSILADEIRLAIEAHTGILGRLKVSPRELGNYVANELALLGYKISRTGKGR